jgi:hypothetical protein
VRQGAFSSAARERCVCRAATSPSHPPARQEAQQKRNSKAVHQVHQAAPGSAKESRGLHFVSTIICIACIVLRCATGKTKENDQNMKPKILADCKVKATQLPSVKIESEHLACLHSLLMLLHCVLQTISSFLGRVFFYRLCTECNHQMANGARKWCYQCRWRRRRNKTPGYHQKETLSQVGIIRRVELPDFLSICFKTFAPCGLYSLLSVRFHYWRPSVIGDKKRKRIKKSLKNATRIFSLMPYKDELACGVRAFFDITVVFVPSQLFGV